MNAENLRFTGEYKEKSGKRTAALLLAMSVALGGVLAYVGHSKQQAMATRIDARTAEWTKERVEKVLAHIPGTSNSELIPETIKVVGAGYKIDFAIRNKENNEAYIIHCNIDDSSCSNPYPIKYREYPNIIPSGK